MERKLEWQDESEEKWPAIYDNSKKDPVRVWSVLNGDKYILRVCTYVSRREDILTLPADTPFEEVKEAMYNLMRLGIDTGP